VASLIRRMREDPKERAVAGFALAAGVPAVAGIALAAALEIWWMYAAIIVLYGVACAVNNLRVWRKAKLGNPPAPPMRSLLAGVLLIGVSVGLMVAVARG
jgi:hypothetical protein